MAKGSVLESAKRLKNFTISGKQLQDKMDVVFISKTVENYLEYVTKEREVIMRRVLCNVVHKIISGIL